MTTSRRLALSSLLALAAGCGRGEAQSGANSISGRLTVRGRPLASAAVGIYLLNQNQTGYSKQWETSTDADGQFSVKSLPQGTYVVVMRYQGKVVYQNKVDVPSAQATKLEVDLT